MLRGFLAACAKGDKVVDYFFMLSFDPQYRWPITSHLWTHNESSQPQWQIPADGHWLNKDTTYYWKVQARDSRGVKGEWSPVFSFRTVR